MAVRIIDLQLIYGIEGARSHFERLCAQLIRSKFPDAKGIRVHNGDGGVDTYVGAWAEGEGIHVFQIKFFPTGLGDDQKKQVRESFKTCLTNPRFTTAKWTLCLPVDLSKDEVVWFDNWKNDVAQGVLTSNDIDWWGETALEELLFKRENEGVKNAFFKEEYLTQIRDMHGILRGLVDDIVIRLGGPPKETVTSSLVNYFQYNVDSAQRVLRVILQSNLPTIRFDTTSWIGLTPYALSTYPTSLYMSMAEAVRLLSQGNSQIEAIWDTYKSNKYPPGSGINPNVPSQYVTDAMYSLNLLIRTKIAPILLEVLKALDAV